MTTQILERYIDIPLKTIRDLGLGPTLASRLLYLTSVLMYYISSCQNVSRGSVIREMEVIDVLHGSSERFESLLHRSYDYLYTKLGYPKTHLTEPAIVIWNTPYSWVFERVKSFIDMVDEDGWRNASQGFHPPNGNFYVDVENGSGQDLASMLPHKDLWTPLKHAGANPQNYLTPNWGEVTPPNNANIENYRETARENYKPEYRQQEIDELLQEYQSLNDEKRMIAEYFQGGQVTPPGFWNVLSLYVLKSTPISSHEFCKFHYLLNVGIFTAGIVAWGVKKEFMQARPIQEIRCITPQRMVTNYDGELITSREWRAFQQHHFQAPPFADYISGHSTFSSTAANIFEAFFPNFFKQPSVVPFSLEHCQMISPVIKNTYPSSIRCALMKIKSSEVHHPSKAFPVGACRLDFTSWRHIATLSGVSRIYGGIHANNANATGLIIGEQIAQEILTTYV
jgi:hypothetical protein